MIAILAFYLFATLTIASAIAVIFARNPVHSVLWLILAFFNAAGLMLLLGAEFIAMLLVIVYVGAVAVLFLFVVMMLDIDFASLALRLHPQPAVRDHHRAGAAGRDHRRGQRVEGRAGAQPAAPIPAAPSPNIVALGQLLYSRYLFPFEIAGPDPAGGDDRRDRAHPPQPRRHAPAERLAARSRRRPGDAVKNMPSPAWARG